MNSNMKTLNRFFTIGYILLLLVACTNHALMTKHAEQASCKMTCQLRLKSCQHVCHDDCRTCSEQVQKSVKRSYDQYIHEIQVQGGIISRELNSFKDPLQCRKTSCDCSADYDVCTQSCKGLIHKNVRVPSACC